MTDSAWTTHRLAEYLEVFGAADLRGLEQLGVVRAAETLDAEVGVLCDGESVIASVGFQQNRAPEEMLLQVAAGPRSAEVHIEGLGDCHMAIAPVDDFRNLMVIRAGEPFDREEETLLRSMGRALALGRRVAGAIEVERELRHASERQAAENEQLAARLDERHQLMSSLFRIQQSISHRAPLQDVLDAVVSGASELLRVEMVGLRIRAMEPGAAHHTAVVGLDESVREALSLEPMDIGPSGRAYRSNRLVVVDDVERRPALLDGISDLTGRRPTTMMSAPVHRNGEPVGLLTVSTEEPGRRFSEDERALLLQLAEHASLAVNDASAVHELRIALEGATRRARHDGLTGLLNRAACIEALDRSLASASAERPIAALFVDLDRFKAINDVMGHATGDEVLTEVAERLGRAVRSGDVVARLAGDEFVVVTGPLARDEAVDLAERLVVAVSAPMVIGARELSLTASVGVAEAVAPTSGEDLLADADVAMYRAKKSGRDRVVRFDQRMRAEATDRVELERDLAIALRDGQLRVHYQPGVGLDTGAVESFEALVRWQHPTRGLLAPVHFIDVAEETGLIAAIDRFVLREACGQLARWRAEIPAADTVSISTNLSARQFGDPGLIELVAGVLRANNLDAGSLAIEVTERVVMEEEHVTHATLDALRGLGVRLMVDDFGTGYSSLVYLKRFPFDVLKIDRGFVDGVGGDREDEAIVTAIIALADALGLSVVAEGIENPRQLDWIRRAGCRWGQGYLFSPPVTPDAAAELLRSGFPAAIGT